MNTENLSLYEKVRSVPPEAQKPIQAGRLKGMIDINPMWRIKVLTEQFGPSGFGWYYEITKQWVEEGSEGQKVVFTNINLYVKSNDEWSKPIQGTGGSSFISKEKAGLYTSDECYKMSLTDAISVACKSLGVGADVYYAKDRSKYTSKTPPDSVGATESKNKGNNIDTISDAQKKRLFALSKGNTELVKKVLMSKGFTKSSEIPKGKVYNDICKEIEENVK